MASFVALSAVSVFWSTDVESTLTRIGTYSQLLIAVWLIWELAAVEYASWADAGLSAGDLFCVAAHDL